MAHTANPALAFEQALAAYDGKIATFARNSAYAVPGFDEEDIKQELRVVLWRCVERYDPDRGAQFNTLFQGCARNHIIGLIRRSNTKSRKGTVVSMEQEDVAAAVDMMLADFSAEDIALANMAVAERLATPAGRRKARAA